MKHLVVMEARTGARMIWAWGKVGDEPGFEDITYTANDGFSPVDLEGDDAPRLERHLFTVAVSDEADEQPRPWIGQVLEQPVEP